MPRPRTRPLDDEPTAAKKALRKISKKHKGDDPSPSPTCDDMIAMIGNRQKYIAAGDLERAEQLRKNLARSTTALAKLLAARRHQ